MLSGKRDCGADLDHARTNLDLEMEDLKIMGSTGPSVWPIYSSTTPPQSSLCTPNHEQYVSRIPTYSRRSHDILSELKDPATARTQKVDTDPDIVSKVPNRGSLLLHIQVLWASMQRSPILEPMDFCSRARESASPGLPTADQIGPHRLRPHWDTFVFPQASLDVIISRASQTEASK